MAAFTYEMEVATSIPPAKMFKAFVLVPNFIPKLLPQAIKSVDIVQGNGGVGTIKQINFGEGSQFKYAKERIDVIDKKNFTYAYTVIEGDVLMDKLEKITNEIKFEASSNGGSICKGSSKYYPAGNHEIKEEEIKAGKEKAIGILKAVEAYLLANPDA